ncbi:MAG TPA: hypothetical protein VFC63_19075 [Blastocatellia bacterium]|nr:hypothetical protein [Blastocatellia bacterium]
MLRVITKLTLLFERVRGYFDASLTDQTIDKSTGLLQILEKRELLVPTAIAGLGGTAILWFLIITQSWAWEFFFQLPGMGDSRLGFGFTFLRAGVVFAFPFFGLLSLLYLLWPSVTEEDDASGLLTSYTQKSRSERRYRLVLAAGMFAALNLLLMILWRY